MTSDIQPFSKKFVVFEREHGRSFVWGHLLAPYDGCFYKNMVVLVKGSHAFFCAELQEMTDYGRWSDRARYVVEPPKGFDSKYLRAGCVRLNDVPDVMGCDMIEIHPISELAKNTPNMLVKPVILMCEELGIDIAGQFLCPLCKCDLSLSPDEIEYFESEHHGDGGIGIDVGEPVCSECRRARTCGSCGYDGLETWQVDVDYDLDRDCGDYHCIHCCVDDRECRICGDTIDFRWDSSKEDIEYWRKGVCQEDECREKHEAERREAELEAKRQAAMGNLFDPKENKYATVNEGD